MPATAGQNLPYPSSMFRAEHQNQSTRFRAEHRGQCQQVNGREGHPGWTTTREVRCSGRAGSKRDSHGDPNSGYQGRMDFNRFERSGSIDGEQPMSAGRRRLLPRSLTTLARTNRADPFALFLRPKCRVRFRRRRHGTVGDGHGRPTEGLLVRFIQPFPPPDPLRLAIASLRCVRARHIQCPHVWEHRMPG